MKALKSIIICLSILLCYNVEAQETAVSEYDQTIDKLIPKAKKNKLSEKQLLTLTNSYHQANQNDHQRIMELKKSGQPDIWIEIYYKANNINSRQNKITTLPDNIKTSMNFKALNLDSEITNSREKAELYIYAKTIHLLKDINEENLKEAQWLVDQLRKINPQSNNIEELMIKLAVLPSKHIYLGLILPQQDSDFPNDFKQTALNFDNKNIYGIPFDTSHDNDTDYDLFILVNIDKKSISPERIDAVTFEERNNGKVAKITDKTMSKSANISGTIAFIDVKKEVILINTPFDIGSTFVYHYAEMSGDKEACSEQTLQLLKSQTIDFPSDNTLLKDTARKLNQILKNHYQKN